MSTSESADERYQLCAALNRTELLQLVRRLGYDIHPGCPDDVLLTVLLDREPPEKFGILGNPIDAWRWGLINFISEHWQKLRPQLTCPAKDLKTTNPEPCFGCTDLQVITCIVQAGEKYPRNIQLISDLRKYKT